MPAKGTRPTQVRLTPKELEDVEMIKAQLGIRTTSDVIRQGLARMKRIALATPRSRQSEENPE